MSSSHHPTLKVTVDSQGRIEVRTLWPDIESIVIGGCGARGPGYIGFLRQLEKYKVLDPIRRSLGVSAGAIATLMLALGYTADEAEAIFAEKPMMHFLEKAKEYSAVRKVATVAIADNVALSSGQELLIFIEMLIERKLGNRHATFADLERAIEREKNEGLKPTLRYLYIIASNMSYEDPVSEIFFCEKDKGKIPPNAEIARVIFASAALPYVFPLVPIYKVDHQHYAPTSRESLKTPDSSFFYSEKELKPHRESIFEPDIDRMKILSKNLYPLLNKNNNENKTIELPREDKDIHDEKTNDDEKYDKYCDGGLISNAPDYFNQNQFLPKNYQFIKSMNPSVLVTKIDSAELGETIIGKGRKSKVTGIKDYTKRVTKAATSNLNLSKMRDWHEALMYLPLFDMDINTLELNLDTDKTNLLISGAEQVTEDFLQRYCYSEPPAEVYDNLKSWLNTLNIIQLTYFIGVYINMRNELTKQSQNKKEENRDVNQSNFKLEEKYDPDQPSVEMLSDRIEFLQALKHYKEQLIQGNVTKFSVQFPTQHINIKPDIPVHSWVQHVKKSMEWQLAECKLLLTQLESQIDTTKQKMCNMFCGCKLFRTFIDNPKLHEPAQYYCYLQEYVEATESYKKCLAKIVDLEFKLKLPHTSPAPDVSEYAEFINKITTLKNQRTKVPLLDIVLKRVNLIHQHLVYESHCKDDKLICVLDLKDKEDQKLFVLSCVLYKLYSRNSDNTFDDLFFLVFPKETKLPKSLSDVIRLLNYNLLNQLATFYKIEKLLNSFEKIKTPTSDPNINFDVIFDVIKYSFGSPMSLFLNNNKQEIENKKKDAIKMNDVFKVFPRNLLSPLDKPRTMPDLVQPINPDTETSSFVNMMRTSRAQSFAEFCAFKPVRK